MGIYNRIFHVIRNNRMLSSFVSIVFIFISIYISNYLYLHYFKTSYIFEWVNRNNYFGIWVIGFFGALLGQSFIAYGFSIGNLLGLFIGNTLGEYLDELSKARLSYQEYTCKLPYAWALWIGTIIITILIFGYIKYLKNHKKDKYLKKMVS